MKFSVLVISALAVILGSVQTFAAGSVQDHVIQMKSISFDPKKIEIHQKDTVTWQNVSYSDHSATSADPEKSPFDTGQVAPKARSKKIVFAEAGVFKYHCSIHGKTMSGEITVSPAKVTP